VIGWAMETHLRTELVLVALNMAVAQRRPTDVIHHSDQGCQYTSVAFGKRCAEAGVRPSMGSVGDAYDNALCESFFATLECELLDRHRFRTQVEPASPSSTSSKAGITRGVVIPRSITGAHDFRAVRGGRRSPSPLRSHDRPGGATSLSLSGSVR
jgi:transposase InsO family protein